MVPLFAAVSAADTASSIAGSATSLWKHKSSAGSTAAHDSKSATSFAALLKSNGVDVSKYVQKPVSTLTAGTTSGAATHANGSVNQIA